MALLDIARRVKAGVKFLDAKVPNWRTVLRRHEDEFDFADGDHCVLGTLEHYSGRLRELKRRRKAAIKPDNSRYGNACAALDLTGKRDEALGFDFTVAEANEDVGESTATDAYDALWRAEFERPS